MLIGLTGLNGAGKGVAADYLKTKSFYCQSLSDVIREEVKSRKQRITRKRLIAAGRELREKFGDSILADRVLQQIEPDKNYVIDSIRHPAEVTALRSRKDFFLITVDADAATRFKRIKARKREQDPTTIIAFQRLEREESASGESGGQRLLACMTMADIRLANNGSLTVFHRKIDTALTRLLKKKRQRIKRPSWDEYFMNITVQVSRRSNCVKRKVAAIVVKDRRIISTGYNGTPRGVTNCDEGGCPRCGDFTTGGTKLEECLCSHGEENAIVQASYHGISLNGSIMYTTFSPCLWCSKMIINAGIREVVYNADYPLAGMAKKMLAQAHVKLRKFSIGISQ